MEAAKTIAQAFISCHLDCCNSLLYGIFDSLLQRLQSVQNAAARLVTGTRRCDHITPVALVTSLPANSFQDCRLGFPGTDRPSTCLHRHGWRGGLVVGRRTCDLVVVGSRPGRDAAA